MAEGRYYWLKLKRDFFKRHDIRIVEEMPNGKDYILFYLKMLVESIDHEGELRFSDTIPYDAKMLSVVTNTNIDTVKNAMDLFTSLGMIEIFDDKTIFMRESQLLVGSETKSAVYKRNQREKQKALAGVFQLSENKVDNVHTMSTQCPKNVLVEKETEIELELEKELEKEIEQQKEKENRVVVVDIQECIKKFESIKGTLITEFEINTIKKLLEDYSKEWVLDALEVMGKAGKIKLGYVEGILNNWKTEGRNRKSQKEREEEKYQEELMKWQKEWEAEHNESC